MPPSAKNKFFESRIRSGSRPNAIDAMFNRLEEVLCVVATPPPVLSQAAPVSPQPAASAVSRRLALEDQEHAMATSGSRPASLGTGCSAVIPPGRKAVSAKPKNFARVWAQDDVRTPRSPSRKSSVSPRPESPRNVIRKSPTAVRRPNKLGSINSSPETRNQ